MYVISLSLRKIFHSNRFLNLSSELFLKWTQQMFQVFFFILQVIQCICFYIPLNCSLGISFHTESSTKECLCFPGKLIVLLFQNDSLLLNHHTLCTLLNKNIFRHFSTIIPLGSPQMSHLSDMDIQPVCSWIHNLCWSFSSWTFSSVEISSGNSLPHPLCSRCFLK